MSTSGPDGRGDALGSITVPSRYEGPPGLGHGGWAVWCLRERVGRPLTVALRAPIPLATPLAVFDDGERVVAVDETGDEPTLVLEASGWTPDVPDTAAVSLDAAVEARGRFPLTGDAHPLPRCFVCGTEHDSQHIHAGPLEDGRFACDWQVPADAGSAEAPAIEGLVHGVLDCCAHWYVSCRQPFRQAFTVQYAVDLVRSPEPGEPCVVVAWNGDHAPEWDGRKAGAASAVFDTGGELLASARSFWVAVR